MEGEWHIRYFCTGFSGRSRVFPDLADKVFIQGSHRTWLEVSQEVTKVVLPSIPEIEVLAAELIALISLLIAGTASFGTTGNPQSQKSVEGNGSAVAKWSPV